MQTKQDNNRKIAFLIVSCDKYSDLWVPFFTLLDKYWPEIYYKKYLLSNSKEFSWPGVNQINIGEDISYSDNLLKCIDHIDEDWILLWLEDLFLSSPVNTTKLDRIISVFTKNESGYLKIAPDMPLSYTDDEIGELPKGIKYRSAIGATLYHRSTLKKLLSPGFSAWDIDKSNSSDSLDDPFYAFSPESSKELPIKYINTLIRGKWSKTSIKFLKKEGFIDILKNRDVESFYSWFYAILFQFRLSLFKYLRIHWK